ncbi:hypothetical protein [Streptomyces virginiae]
MVRSELVTWGAPPAHILAGLADHEDPMFRQAACRAWEQLADEVRELLLHDEDPHVRQAAALRVCHEDEERTTWIVGRSGNGWHLGEVLARGRLTRELAERLLARGERRTDAAFLWPCARSAHPWLRRSAAVGLEPELLDRLARDPDTRAAAGRDPRLAVSRIRELLADPDSEAGPPRRPIPRFPPRISVSCRTGRRRRKSR